MADDFGAVTPLSESVLWRLNRAWFEREGPAAWSTGTVPSMITTNAVMGLSYARVVVEFLRRWAETSTAEERRQPVHIVELGAGSGRFAYNFVRKLEPRLRAVPALRDLRVTYVMTDFARSTIDGWRRHERLAPLVVEGRLDFAAFDGAWPAPLRLVQSGTDLDPAAPAPGPLIVLANYVIDGLPLDSFVHEGGVFGEHVVRVVTPYGMKDISSLDDIRLSWGRRAVAAGRYEDPELERLLRSLAGGRGDRTILLPVAFLRTLRYLRSLATGPLLFLTADKGWSRTPIGPQGEGPGMATHGSVSFMVDYSVIATYVRQQGGVAFVPPHQPASLATAAFVLGGQTAAWSELGQLFTDVVVDGGPDDWFQLKEMLDGEQGVPTLAQLMARLRAAQWDSWVFLDLFRAFMIRTIFVTEDERLDVRLALRNVEELYFPIGEHADVPFCVAAVLWRIGDPAAALRLLAWSERLHGPDGERSTLAALCHRERGDLAAARHATTLAIKYEPDLELPYQLVNQLELDATGAGVRADGDDAWSAALWVSTRAPGRPCFQRMPDA
ncbi:MAG: SAM-dependent methyltransferase [Acidimicrobiia bacterium]|nr:SAM-dependent methyltransferase [Acidimicrobiia bacterium]